MGVGAAWGLLLAIPAIFTAMLSGGAGHGDYVAARLLFPFTMLLTLSEEGIGSLGISVALIQFPIYGAVLSWSSVRKRYLPAAVLASLHLLAAAMCFARTLPDFS